MALWKELCPNKEIFTTLKSQKWAAGGEKEVSRKGVSSHLNETKPNKTPMKEKSSSNTGGRGDGKEAIPRTETTLHRPLKKFFPNVKL